MAKEDDFFQTWLGKGTDASLPAPKEESAEERTERLQLERTARQAGIFFQELLKSGFTRAEALALTARGMNGG